MNGLESLYNQVKTDAMHRGPSGADAYFNQTMAFLRGLAQANIANQRGQGMAPSFPPPVAQTVPYDHQALIRYLTQTPGGQAAADLTGSGPLRRPAGSR